MTIEQLLYFNTICTYKNITRAADALYISQPTLSRQIAQLEQEMGCQLIIRDHHGCEPTEVGKIFLQGARDILQQIDDLKVEVRNAHENLSGRLRVASVNVHNPLLNSLYRQYTDIYPSVQFAMRKVDDIMVSNMVKTKEADLGITFSFSITESVEDSGLASMTLYEDELVLIMSDRSDFSKKNNISLKNLPEDHHFLFLRQLQLPFMQAIWEDADLTARLDQEVRRPDSIESVLLQIGADNKALSLLPKSMLTSLPPGCCYSEIEDIDTSYDIVILWRQDDRSPALETFLELTRNVLH